jgi:hypothetical protein
MGEHDPDPLSDVRQGLGLLLRAAVTAARKLPTKDLEEAVVTSAREVGRAIENVASTIERQVFGKNASKKGSSTDGDPNEQDSKEDKPHGD